MTRKRIAAVVLFVGGASLSLSAGAQTGPGEVRAPLPPSVQGPDTAAPAKKPRNERSGVTKQKRDPLALPDSASARDLRRGAGDKSPAVRRIDPSEIADPYGGIGRGRGGTVRPTMSPSGRPGLGGRF